MAFKDLRDFTGGAFIDLPIDGRSYRINDVDGETGLLVQKLIHLGMTVHQGKADEADLDETVLDDVAEHDLFERVLGDAYEQLLADGVGWDEIKHVAMTAMLWIAFDKDTAARYWETGKDAAGEAAAPAPGPNRATRRASAAAARTTRKPGSGSTTRASKSATKTRSPGKRSSASGR